MSQKSEKIHRHLERQDDELRYQGQRIDALEIKIATDYAAANRKARGRARQAENTARKWRCCTWLAVIALMLCAALCLTIKAKAQPELPVVVDELVEPEDFENEKIEAALLEKANVIEGCTVTWYTEATCGKKPGDPAYGITRSGMPVVEHLTCAVDPDVIPLYSDVFVQYADGTIEQLWATDTGVRGNSLDIYTPDYDYAIQCGRQSLTVWWAGPEEEEVNMD